MSTNIEQAIDLREAVVALFHGGADAVEVAFADDLLGPGSVYALADLLARLRSLLAGLPT